MLSRALRRLSTAPRVSANGDSRFVVERRRFREEVHAIRKQYIQEMLQKEQEDAAAAAAEREAIQRRKQERLELRRRRIAENDAYLAKARAQAEAQLEAERRISAKRALAGEARRREWMAGRVAKLAEEAKHWITEDNLDTQLVPQLFSEVQSPVNDTPGHSRRAPGPDASLSGSAPDRDLLLELARERTADLPIWLRHTILPPSEGT